MYTTGAQPKPWKTAKSKWKRKTKKRSKPTGKVEPLNHFWVHPWR